MWQLLEDLMTREQAGPSPLLELHPTAARAHSRPTLTIAATLEFEGVHVCGVTSPQDSPAGDGTKREGSSFLSCSSCSC